MQLTAAVCGNLDVFQPRGSGGSLGKNHSEGRMMTPKFIKCRDKNGKEIIIRIDMICAIEQNTYNDGINTISPGWTAKVILIGGNEIFLSTPYVSIVSKWAEAIPYE